MLSSTSCMEKKNEGRSRGTTKQAHQENTKTRAKNTKKNRSGVGVWGTFMSIGYSGIYLAGEKGGDKRSDFSYSTPYTAPGFLASRSKGKTRPMGSRERHGGSTSIASFGKPGLRSSQH